MNDAFQKIVGHINGRCKEVDEEDDNQCLGNRAYIRLYVRNIDIT